MSNFPHATAYLDVHNSSGEFIHGLLLQDITVEENGNQVQVNGLMEEKPGVQFVVAIAPGATYGIRDATGTSRYGYLIEGVQAGTWLKQSSNVDDFSLITMGGPQLSHSSNPAMLSSQLASYLPEDPKTAPNLEALAAALQVVSAPTLRPGMERAILFITPPQPAEISLGLQSILASANQQRIHIFIWLVAPTEAFELPEIDLLRNLAIQTNASFFAFSHDEPIPDLETLLEPLRYVYQVGYDSQASTAGAQEVIAHVNIGGEQFSSQPQTYELNLQAPIVKIVDPPTEIARKYTAQATPGTAGVLSDLQPSEKQLYIQVDFPDGYARPIAHTSLFVDGALVMENSEPPYEQLLWDLRSYTQDGTHTVRVEAVDNLGWLGQSVEYSVRVTVPSTTQQVVSVVSQKRVLIVGITVLISASVLVLVLIMGGSIRPRPYPGQIKPSANKTEVTQSTGYRQRLRQQKDPVTQPVKIGSALSRKTIAGRKNWWTRLHWLKHAETPIPALAHLLPLTKSDEATLPAPMEIMTGVVTLGSDPQKASLVISDPSIEGLHATIRQEGKSFRITDAGSVAGTWVNYQPASAAGILLEHADIIHLGRIGFRFTLPEPGAPRKVIVTPMEPEQ